MAIPEEIEFTFDDGTSKKIIGDLPNDQIHSISIFILCSLMGMGVLFTAVWAEENAPQIGYIIITLLVSLMCIAIAISLVKNTIFNSEKTPTGVSSSDIPRGLTHMYFAAMSLRSSDGAAQSKSDMTSKELDEIRDRLFHHEKIITSIISAKDIFSAPSPSLGVMAIRVSTETIMRHACDNVGVSWKPNARPTLKSYVESYLSLIHI